MSAPELTCECCAAGGCPHAARRALGDLRARHGHAIQVVADPGASEAFLYTVGADPEFLVEDVPNELVNVVGAMMNFFVERVRSGHPVRDGQRSFKALSWRRLWRTSARPAAVILRWCVSNRCPSGVSVTIVARASWKRSLPVARARDVRCPPSMAKSFANGKWRSRRPTAIHVSMS